jgi:hypothetical protein
LRQNGRYLLKPNDHRNYQRLDSLVQKPGQREWLEKALLTAKYASPINFWAYWKPDEKVPWLLATNMICSRTSLQAYRCWMWIEMDGSQMTNSAS